MKGNPRFNFWRKCRLASVEVYENRFVEAPEIFRCWKLPLLKSYYLDKGQYLWSGKGMK